MPIVDDEGRLFGVVNVVDLIVVLLVVAVAVAGGLFLLSNNSESAEPTPTETRYVTLDLGVQQAYIADRIERGDSMSVEATDELTITDVYATDTRDGRHVLVRAALRGDIGGGSIDFGGGPPRLGRQITITTDEYSVTGDITAVDTGGERLDLRRTRVLVGGVVSTEMADQISANDTIVRGNRTVTSVESFRIYETENPDERRIVLVADVLVHEGGGSAQFGLTPVRVGRTLQFTADKFEFRGTLLRIGVSELPVTETDVLLQTELDADQLSRLDEGDEYQVNGHTIATIQSVEAFGTGAGRVAYVGVTYQTYQPREVPRFGVRRVQEGTTLPFRTEEYQFRGQIVRENALEPRGTETRRTVTLELENVEPDIARSVEVGLTEQVHGETIVDISDVDVEPAQIVLTSDDGNVFLRDHPVNKDVTITADLQVRESATGITFKGETLRQGETVLLDFGTVVVRATVADV